MSTAFSVVIPVYNGALTLPQTLDCLVLQTCQDFEVILVNDGSKDSSEIVIQNFIQANPEMRIRYLSQANKGLGGARNTGLRAASGSFLALIDQDDIWYPNKLEKVLAVFKGRPEILFVTHHLYRRVHGHIREIVYTDSLNGSLFRKLLFDTNFLCGCAMAFRRSVLDKIGYFTEERGFFHLSEDYDYWLRASAAGFRFYLIPEVLGEYIEHRGNFSRNLRLMYRNEWNVVRGHYKTRPVRKFWDPILLGKRRGKILVRQTLALLGMK